MGMECIGLGKENEEVGGMTDGPKSQSQSDNRPHKSGFRISTITNF
jgi:hypothetical protein